MLVCSSCEAENREGARFCDSCGAPLAETAPVREVRKVVTVLFCDVTGSTALGERIDPESLRRGMARYFETAKVIAARHGGSVETSIMAPSPTRSCSARRRTALSGAPSAPSASNR
jgi:class 3 adenylate cyclase